MNHWTDNPKWTNALEKYYESNKLGSVIFNLDMRKIEEILFGDNTPAYEFMDAMKTVYEQEGHDGHRGCPETYNRFAFHAK